ncbi:ABC transporter substrate-binding protein [Erysipelotrichaceae bacterium NYU-BL-E8]|uniref:ABC transporter substrate-binding protein n=2 Tax=Ileibacterium valens TaxID=1862668 RepID=A0A1U7NCS9_9FIRM|nr:ABC transporter substrate-binding protein [Ileibacterium valens]OLU37110.1 ABC transporter substrate-binding protein [Erysipelotrichaceae bacterium NYU-BL-F16]OLU37225.1 ABC transporter substrate-binding protein [Erysipelotrichaceae bacterium NYU-BL-E8]
MLTALLSVFCMVFLFGCHGAKTSSSFEMPEAFDETKPVEITFWAKNDTNKNQTDVYKKAIADFEKMYPNIHVNLKLYTDYGKIYNDIITNIATGTTPNVAITYPDHIASYLQGANTVVAMDELMDDPAYGLGGSELKFDGPKKEEIVSAFLNEGVIQDQQYALPFMRSTEALYINKTLVEKLGYEVPDVPTWEWIWEVSEAATKKNPDGTYALNNQKVLIPFIYKSTDNMLITMLKQQDAGYSTDEGEIEIFNDTTSADLEEIASHAKSGAFSTFKISGYPANFLNASQTLFAVDSTAGATWMGANAPLSDISEGAKTDFETVVRPVPQVDVENIEMISQGPSIALFSKDNPQEVLASWLFAQYLLSNEVQLGYAKTEGYLPVTDKVLESSEYQEYLSLSGTDNNEHYSVKIDAAKLLMDHLDDTFVTPVFNGSASLRNAAGELVESVVKSTRRKETIDESYLQDLYSKVNTLYRLDQLSQASGSKKPLGKMPASSIWLLSILAIVWIGIIIVFIRQKLQQKKAQS